MYAWLQYELLDEIMDFGYPQFTEAKILSEFIKTDSYRLELSSTPKANIAAVTNAVSWRSEGIRYKKNEVRFAACLLWMFSFSLEAYWREHRADLPIRTESSCTDFRQPSTRQVSSLLLEVSATSWPICYPLSAP